MSENKTNKKCEGCYFYYEMSLHGGDMPTTYCCTNSESCINQIKHYNNKMIASKIKNKDFIDRSKIASLCHDALMTDGSHHKQWFLEEILKEVVMNFDELRDFYDWDEGIPD